MKRSAKHNVLLVEMIVVVLFFCLSTAVSMGIFAAARRTEIRLHRIGDLRL